MKKGLVFAVFFCSLLLVSGMGGSRGTPKKNIPLPDQDFSATFIDKKNKAIQCTQVTMDGEVFFFGNIGGGKVTVPFENIKEGIFKEMDERVFVAIELKSGKTVEIEVDEDEEFYGSLEFGTFQIEASELKKIVFESP